MVAVDPQPAAPAPAAASGRRHHRRVLAATAASAVALAVIPVLGGSAVAAPAAQVGYQVVSAATTAQGQPLATTFSSDAYIQDPASGSPATTPPPRSVPTRQAFVDGPLAPPYGYGSRQATFDAVDSNGADASGQQTEVYRTTAFNNVPLRSISELRFSTFGSNLDGGTRVPRPFTLRLSVDRDGNDTVDNQLTYLFSATPALATWQTFVITQSSGNFQVDGTPPNAPITLQMYTAAFPNAKILENNAPGSQPSRDTGTGLVGGGGGAATARSQLAVDGLGVQFGATDSPESAGNVLYDFEGTRTSLTAPTTAGPGTFIDPFYAPCENPTSTNPCPNPTNWGKRTIASDGTAGSFSTAAALGQVPGPPASASGVPAAPAGPPFRTAGNPLPGSAPLVQGGDPAAIQELRGNPLLAYGAAGRNADAALPLRDLQQLRYATWVQRNSDANTVAQQPAYLSILVTLSGSLSDTANFRRLYFFPGNQSPTGTLNPALAENTWQTWDLVLGRVDVNPFTGSLSATPTVTSTAAATPWTQLLAQYPNAKTVPTLSSSDPTNAANGTVAFGVGGAGQGTAQQDQTSFVDGFRVALRSLINPTFGYPTLTNDFEPAPVVAVRGSTVTEQGNQRSTQPLFQVLPIRTLNQPVSVTYSTADGTGKDGTDYTAVPPTTVTIPAGAAGTPGKIVNVDIRGNDVAESDVTVLLNAAKATANEPAAFVVPQATGTIRDDDAPAITVGDATAPEGSPVQIPLTLNRAAASDVTLTYASVDGTATAPDDYTAVSGKITIPAGTTRVTVPVPTSTDSLAEGPETFELRFFDLKGGPATLPRTAGTGTITDVAAGGGGGGTGGGGTGGSGTGGGGATTVPDLTLKVSKTFATLGSRVTYSGGLTRGNTVLAGVPVLVTVKYVDGQVKPIGLATTGPNGSFAVTTKPLYNGTVTATALGATASTPSRVIVVFPRISASQNGPRVTLKASVAPGFITGPNRNLRVQLLLVDGSGKVLKVLDTRNAAARHGLAGYAQGVNDVTFTTGQLASTARYAVKVIGTPVNTGATSRAVTVQALVASRVFAI